MTRLALLFLVLTSLAPIGLVYAAVLIDNDKVIGAGIVAGMSVILVTVCWGLLFAARRASAPVPKSIAEVSAKDGESLGFLVAYALPIIALKSPTFVVSWGLLAFTLIMGIAIWQQQVFHVNPLLALLGYHFFAARNDGGAQVLILTRNKLLEPSELQVVRLSDYLWLEHRTPGVDTNGKLPSGNRPGSQGSGNSP